MKCFRHEIGKVCPDCGLDRRGELIQRIKDALGTAEDGEALIEVARNAHNAEMITANVYRLVQEHQDSQILSQIVMEAIDNG